MTHLMVPSQRPGAIPKLMHTCSRNAAHVRQGGRIRLSPVAWQTSRQALSLENFCQMFLSLDGQFLPALWDLFLQKSASKHVLVPECKLWAWSALCKLQLLRGDMASQAASCIKHSKVYFSNHSEYLTLRSLGDDSDSWRHHYILLSCQNLCGDWSRYKGKDKGSSSKQWSFLF